MVHPPLGTLLHHIHRLAGAPGFDDLGDGQLLEHFTAHGDEAAFTTLVRRHGPMVLGVCRRVLPQSPDAEDAFQATFLVLFRRARSLDRGGSVANWLYTVAYHVALRAKAEAARRQRHEREVQGMSHEPSTSEAAWVDLQPVLDEELARLPDKYRLPVLLCYLEGKTNEEAARLLGWPTGTVKGRLSRARDLLRARLARRGIALSAGLLAAFLVERTAVAVPALLLAAAVRTVALAAAGLPCPSAAALAAGLLRTSLGGKVKMAAALVLVLLLGALLGGAGVLEAGARARPNEGTAVSAGAPAAPTAAPQGDKPPTETRGAFTVAGQVLDANARPVAGARVAVIGWVERLYRGHTGYQDYETLGTGEADKEGRFRLTCVAESAARFPLRQVLAVAPGQGLGWRILKGNVENTDVAVQLPPEQVIRGRLIDLQGQPLKGVKLHVSEVAPIQEVAGSSSTGSSSTGSSTSSSGGSGGGASVAKSPSEGVVPLAGYGFPAQPERLELWPAALTTDADGRFVLRGLGRDMAVTLLVTDERCARQDLLVLTTATGKPEAFEQGLEPPRLLEGKVTGEDSGKPVGKVLLTIEAQGHRGQHFQLWTDDQGQFRVNCPSGRMTIYPYPADGSPYLTRVKAVDWPKGKVKHEIEVGLPRGVLVRGKVLEAASGKPVAGAVVSYFPRQDNPFAHYTIVSWRTSPGEAVQSKADGTYEATVYPGLGHLLAKGPTPDYVLQKLDTKELALGKPGGAPLYAQAIEHLDLKAGADPQELNLALQRGVTIRGRVLDPDGKPVPEAVIYYPTHLMDNRERAYFHHYSLEPVVVKDGRFELTGCDPRTKLVIHVYAQKKDAGARVELSGADAREEATVRLQPCGKAQFHFVDGDGKPVKDASAGVTLLLDADTGVSVRPVDVPAPIPVPGPPPPTGVAGLPQADLKGPGSPTPQSDADGRVTLTGLVPGGVYRYLDGARTKEFRAEAGKTIELPAIVVQRPRK